MKTQSQLFDWTRFLACLRRDLSLDATKWLLRLVAVFAVAFFLICLFSWPDRYDIENADFSIDMRGITGIFLYLCLILCAVVGAALFMENYVSPQQILNELMLPSSTLEKYLTRIIICIIGFPLLCFASLFLAYTICYLLLMLVFGNVANFDFTASFFTFADWKYWITFLSLQATFMLGSVVWPKNSFIKTTAAILVLGCLWAMFLTFIFSNAMRGKVMSESVDNAQGYIFPAVIIIWTIFCYVTAYFRMKESEIIHRL